MCACVQGGGGPDEFNIGQVIYQGGGRFGPEQTGVFIKTPLRPVPARQ